MRNTDNSHTQVCMQAHAASLKGQRRFLNVHEYISMDLMKEYGVPVPKGAVASTPAEAESIAATMLGKNGSK
jgi:succinyl-CoA synthetase beta subunit